MDEFEKTLKEERVVCVRVKGVKGSAPREAGAFMLVTEAGLYGTIGGGRLEFMAIDEARAMLAAPHERVREAEVPLGPEIGQCCGGRVGFEARLLDEAGKAELAAAEAARRAAMPEVLLFGAGHVGRALARAFALLPVRLMLIDSREDELALAPDVETRLTPLPEAELRAAGAGAAIIISTHDHGLDYLLAKEALERGDAAYVGMIGSKTKRAKFEAWAECETSALHCPMAAGSKGDRRPEVIAAFIAAEVMAALYAHTSSVKPLADRITQ